MEKRSQSPEKKRRRRPLLVLGISSLLTVAVAETALSTQEAFRPWPRYAPGEMPDEGSLSTFLQPDDRVGWSMRPSFEYQHTTDEFSVLYRSNAAGFRSEHRFEPKIDGERILLVGDSYTFGIAVEGAETYGTQLEELSGIPVYNLGMPGFAVDQMWLQVQFGIEQLDPDLVIVGICDADLARSQTAFSLSNGMNKPCFKITESGLAPKIGADRLGPIARFFENRSHLWMGVRQVSRKLGYQKEFGEWWRLNEALFEEIRRTCEEAKLPLFFVYVPTPERRAFPTLGRYTERAGVPYVNLAEAMSGEMFYPADRHFTPAGHAFAAERIFEALGQPNGSLKKTRE